MANIVNDYIKLIIWAALVGGIFAFLWRKGYLLRFSAYIAETREELRKCSWPSAEELKGSTVLVMLTIIMLGIFTVGIDFVISRLLSLIV